MPDQQYAAAQAFNFLGGSTANGSAGQVQFNEGGNLKADSALHWDNTTKRLGIGTATPGSKIELRAGSLYISTDGTTPAPVASGKGLILNYQGVTDKGLIASYDTGGSAYKPLQIEASSLILTSATTGVVGIGTTGPTGKLHVRGTGSSGYDSIVIESTNTGTAIAGIEYAQASTLRWRTYTPEANNHFYITNSSGVGVVLTNGNQAWQAQSDARLKENVRPYPVLDKLERFRAVSFDWQTTGIHDMGVVAQEVYPLFPELVTQGSNGGKVSGRIDDPGVWTVDYARFGVLALEAVKELKVNNDNLLAQLKAANDNQAAQIEELRQEIKALKAAR